MVVCIVYLACLCVCLTSYCKKANTEIAQNMRADVISGGEGFMTHKSLWNAVHASELKHDGGRGAERLGWCLLRWTYSIKTPQICAQYRNKTITRAEPDQWDTNQMRRGEDRHEGLVGCERLQPQPVVP